MINIVKNWFYRVENKHISIVYEHSSYDEGVMKTRDFAKSLLAFGEILEEVNHAINKEAVSVESSIKADFKNKCFMVDLLIHFNPLNGFLFNDAFGLDDILISCGFITEHPKITALGTGVIFSYPAWKLLIKGKTIVNKVINKDTNIATVILKDNNTTIETSHTVSFSLFGLIKYIYNKRRTTNIDSFYKDHLQTKGITQYKSDNAVLGEIQENEKKAILSSLTIKEEKSYDLYEGVELKFITVTSPDEKGSYMGYITEIYEKPKRIDFDNTELQSHFEFENDPFSKKYIVDVLVSYNPMVT